jgi:hypothetical protein
LKIAATVPTGLSKNAPPLPRHVKNEGPLGVYAVNDSVPVADVRVMLLDSSGTVAVDGRTTVGVISNAMQCNVQGPQTTADLGKAMPSDHKNWQPRGGEVEFTSNPPRPTYRPTRRCALASAGNSAIRPIRRTSCRAARFALSTASPTAFASR